MKYSYSILIFLLIANLLAGLAFFDFKNNGDTVQVTFYDIGQGDGMMIEAGNGIQVVIDGGATDKIIEKIQSA